MMGYHHAIVAGAATACAVEAAAALHQLAQPRLPELGVMVACGVGAGLLPDIDEPGATFSRDFGFVGSMVSAVIADCTGGHRGATHTLECIALACVGLHSALRHPLVLGVILGVLVYVALDVLRLHHRGVALLGGVLMVYGVNRVVAPGAWWPLLAVGAGWLSHLLADSLTPHGVPWCLVNVVRHRNLKLPLFHTGSLAEPLVAWSAVGGLAYLAWTLSQGALR